MAWVKDTMIIREIEFPTKIGEVELSRLKYYVDNPRIYSVIRFDDREPEQEEIEKKLLSMEHVKTLIQDIMSNGGLMDPIIVKDKSWEVLEGNSRLAAYRFLSTKNPIKWGRIKCKVLPADIEESYVFALLGQYHIKGKKDWAPYEQAGFLYRRSKSQGILASELGVELGLSTRRVNQLIETFEFMIEKKDFNINRWSYYEEYIKSNRIKKMREEFVELDDVFCGQVKAGKIKKAVDVREKLTRLADGASKLKRQYIRSEIDLDAAYDRLESSGSVDASFRKISAFRSWLNGDETVETVLSANPGGSKKD